MSKKIYNFSTKNEFFSREFEKNSFFILIFFILIIYYNTKFKIYFTKLASNSILIFYQKH
jgi:hypothetical protein